MASSVRSEKGLGSKDPIKGIIGGYIGIYGHYIGVYRTQITEGFRAQIPVILEYLGPEALLFGSLDPLGKGIRADEGSRVYALIPKSPDTYLLSTLGPKRLPGKPL